MRQDSDKRLLFGCLLYLPLWMHQAPPSMSSGPLQTTVAVQPFLKLRVTGQSTGSIDFVLLGQCLSQTLYRQEAIPHREAFLDLRSHGKPPAAQHYWHCGVWAWQLYQT